MRQLRRIIWLLVLGLVIFVTAVMLTVPNRPAWLANAPLIGSYLSRCATSNANRPC